MAITNYKDFLSLWLSGIISFFICCVDFTLTDGCCIQFAALLGRLNRSWFSGKLFTTKFENSKFLLCFGSLNLIEIASLINIFSTKKICSIYFQQILVYYFWCSYKCKSFTFTRFLIKVMLTKQFCLRYCVNLKPKSLYRSSSVESLCKFPINSCFFSEIFLFVYVAWFPFWFISESSWSAFPESIFSLFYPMFFLFWS